jgi:hypothetical protein
MGLLNKLLALIPGDGWKTWVGFVAMILGMFLPESSPVMVVLKQLLEILGISIGSVGVVHKVVKAAQ